MLKMDKSTVTASTQHVIGAAGSLHAFMFILLMMISSTTDPAMRKCVLGIHFAVFVPFACCVQFWFPAVPPAPPMELASFLKPPLPILIGMGALGLLGIIFGDKTKYETKVRGSRK